MNATHTEKTASSSPQRPPGRSAVAIVGAGITGLTAAYELRKAGVPVTVYEAGPRAGGMIRTIRSGEWLAEFGPNSALETSPEIVQLIKDLGIESRRLYSDPRAEKRFIVRSKVPVAMPGSPLRFFSCGLFSWRAKLRLCAEPFIGRGRKDEEENLADFVLRRLGREFLDYAINPFVAGIYAGDPARLSVRQAFPKLHEVEQRYGSLILGQFLGARERKRRGEISKQNAPKFSFDEGLQVLTEQLVVELGGDVRLNQAVRSVEQTNRGWKVTSGADGAESSREHSAVLLTVPAYTLPDIRLDTLQSLDYERLGEIKYPPVASVVLGFKREDVAHPLDGFGMLVPEVENVNILGTIFSSSLFPGRAPRGHVTLTSYLGGTRNPELPSRSMDELIELTVEDLKTILGVRGAPVFQHGAVFPRAIPQYEVGFGRFKRIMNEMEERAPGLFLAGCFRDGISLSDSILSGKRAAERVRVRVRVESEREK